MTMRTFPRGGCAFAFFGVGSGRNKVYGSLKRTSGKGILFGFGNWFIQRCGCPDNDFSVDGADLLTEGLCGLDQEPQGESENGESIEAHGKDPSIFE